MLTIPARAQDNSDWTEHLRLSVPVTLNMKARFSETGPFTLSAAQAGVYADGYVRVDDTGDARGLTGYWGYQNSSQYNAANNTLTMQSDASYMANGSAEKTAQAFVGVELAYGTDLWKIGPTKVGWEVGAGFTPLSVSDSSTLPASVNESFFTFSTAGIVVPTATYSGGPSGVGEPTISDVATPAGTTNVAGTITGQRRLDLLLYTLRAGPTLTWELNPQFSLFGGAGPAVGLLNGNYNYNETIVSGDGMTQNSGNIRMTKPVFGGYANVGVLYHAVPQGDFYLGAQFMPLSGATVSGPGREAHVDLTGTVQFTIGVNWPF